MSSRHRSGYTEAERLGLEWSRRNNALDKISRKLPNEITDAFVAHSKTATDRGSGYRYRTDRDRSRSRDRERRSPSRGRRSRRESSPPAARSSPTYSPYRGNESPERPHDLEQARRRCISRSRSRSRSHSRTKYSDSRRDPLPHVWSHDRFADDEPDRPLPSRLPQDYRPPSPTWVSRAGGVAIMKKKK